MVIAIGTGWPARRLRTMMSSASGNCAPNCLLPPAAHELEHQQRQQVQQNSGDSQRLEQIAAYDHAGAEREQRADRDETAELADAERQAGLQDQPVERDQRQPIVAVAGQPALAAQLDQHALAVGLVLQQLEAAIDVLAVGPRVKNSR